MDENERVGPRVVLFLMGYGVSQYLAISSCCMPHVPRIVGFRFSHSKSIDQAQQNPPDVLGPGFGNAILNAIIFIRCAVAVPVYTMRSSPHPA